MGSTFDFLHETLCAYLGDKADIGLRDELIERAIPLVEGVATFIVVKKKVWLPQHVDGDELFSEGLYVLTPIVEGFNPPERENLSGAFRIHVFQRTYWRLLDYIRKERLSSRTAIDYALRFKAAAEEYERETGFAPTLHEVAGKLGVSDDVAREWRVFAMELDVRNASIDAEFAVAGNANKSQSLHDILTSVPQRTPEERDEGFFALLPPSLTDIERAIVISMYRDNKPMVEIGRAFGLSESRISQMFSGILPRIRAAYFERLRRENGE